MWKVAVSGTFNSFSWVTPPCSGIFLCSTQGYGFPGGSEVSNLPTMQEPQKTQVRSLGREDPWRREWLPTPVFIPGESHRHRSLVGYRPWRHKSQTQLSNWVCSPAERQGRAGRRAAGTGQGVGGGEMLLYTELFCTDLTFVHMLVVYTEGKREGR